jgi:signal peptidase II
MTQSPSDESQKPQSQTGSEPGPAKDPRSWAVLLATTLVGAVIDLWSKSLAFARIADAPLAVNRVDVIRVGPDHLGSLIPPHAPVKVVDQILELTLVLNPGAVFGIGAGKRWFFVAFTAAAIVFALALFAKWTTRRDRWTHFAIGLVLAGGLGNLYDRLVFACVRDFLHPLPGVDLPFEWSWPWGGREVWPYVSNIADAFLIIGIGIMIAHTLRHGDGAKRAQHA